MFILLVAAALPTVPSAVDAERALARDAQMSGQWDALRRYADPDAVIFTPQAVWARDFLRSNKDSTAISWSPNATYVSCDGRMAVNTGPWQTASGGAVGFFTTVWEQEKGQWHWLSLGRHMLAKPLGARNIPVVHKGSCRGRAPGPPLMGPPPIKTKTGLSPDDFGRGYSSDRTLGWDWRVGPNGVRQFRTFLWTGRQYTLALEQTIGGKWGQ